MADSVRALNGLTSSAAVLSAIVDLDQVILDALPTAISVCDARGRLLRFNRKAVELWGRTPRLNDPSESYCGAFRVVDSAGEEMPRETCPTAQTLRDGIGRQGAEAFIENADGRRWTAVLNIEPIKDERGKVAGAIVCFRDFTADAERRSRNEAALSESQRLHREILDALPAAIYTTDAEGRITFYNKAAIEFSGRTPQLGADSWCVSWRLFHPDGRPMPHEECPMALALREARPIFGSTEAVAERPDGTRLPFLPFATPLFDKTGTLIGGVNILVDLSDLKGAERRQQVLIDELNHRVKNTLATVQSIAAQTARDAASLADFQENYEGRLLALSRTHDLLSRNKWEGADLTRVLDQAFEAFGGGRMRLNGPEVRLPPNSAVSVTMMVHELVTNAGKNGALSQAGGEVTISWSVAPDGEAVQLDWQEHGGPPVTPPGRRGFGTRLLERGVERNDDGSPQISFDPKGLRCRMRIPLSDGG